MRYGTQRQIAIEVGVTAQYINDLLAGRRVASAALALKLETATGLSAADWLFADRTELRRQLDKKYI